MKRITFNHLLCSFMVTVLILIIGMSLSYRDVYAASSPANVKGVKVVDSTYEQTTISWKKAKNAKWYEVYRKTEDGKYTKIATIKKGKLEYSDKKVLVDKTYSYRIRGINGKKKGSFSKVCKNTPKLEISNISIEADKNIKLSWEKVPGATKYQINRKDDGSDSFVVLKTVSSDETNYIDADVKENTVYTYSVRAIREYEKTQYYNSKMKKWQNKKPAKKNWKGQKTRDKIYYIANVLSDEKKVTILAKIEPAPTKPETGGSTGGSGNAPNPPEGGGSGGGGSTPNPPAPPVTPEQPNPPTPPTPPEAGGGDESTDKGYITYSPGVVIDELKNINNYTVLESTSNSVKLLAPDNKATGVLKVGDIAVFPRYDNYANNGIAVKITSIKNTGGMLMIEGEPPKAEEVIDSVEVNGNELVEYATFKPAPYVQCETNSKSRASILEERGKDNPPIEYDVKDGVSLNFEYDSKVFNKEQDVEIGEKVTIEGDGKFKAKANLKLDADFKDKNDKGEKIDTVTFGLKNTLDLDITGSGELAGKYYLGEFVLYYDVALAVNADVYFCISENGEYTLELSKTLEPKVEYNRAIKTLKFTNSVDKFEKSIEGKVSLEGTILCDSSVNFAQYIELLGVDVESGVGAKYSFKKWDTPPKFCEEEALYAILKMEVDKSTGLGKIIDELINDPNIKWGCTLLDDESDATTVRTHYEDGKKKDKCSHEEEIEKPDGNPTNKFLVNPRVENDNTTWDCVEFGNYWQSSDEKGGFIKEPIKWRVLQVNDKKAFLLADKCLQKKIAYDEDLGIHYSTWGNCSMRKYLNNTFMNDAFNEKEQNSLLKHVTSNNTTDKIFLLSYEEATNPEFGFDNNRYSSKTRVAESTDYVKAIPDDKIWTDEWWLRSRGFDEVWAMVANVRDGSISESGYHKLDSDRMFTRPAICIDLKTADWKYAGTFSSADAVFRPWKD